MVGPGRVELAAAMGPSSVVVGRILGQDRLQMSLAEDQHPVGDLGPGGEYEPFRKSIRSRAARRDLHGLDTSVGQDCGKRCGELPSPVADQEPEVGLGRLLAPTDFFSRCTGVVHPAHV